MTEVLTLSVLGGWFLLTLWRNVVPVTWRRFLDRPEIAVLVPRWTLFEYAPRDFRLWIRDRDADAGLGIWRPVELSYPRTAGLVLFWNPGFRRSATLFQLLRFQVVNAYVARWRVTRVFPALRTSPPVWAPESIPATMLQRYLQRLPAERGFVERQYAILEGPGKVDDADARMEYLSHFFPLESSAGEP